MYTDASCYHAALGTLLLDAFPGTDPALLLGSQTGTRVVLRDGGLLFGDVVPGLLATLRSRGCHLERTRAAAGGGAAGLAELLAGGTPVVVELDTYYLDHFWMNRGQVHALHSVVLRGFDARERTVRVTDPGDVVFLDERLPLAALEPALGREDLGQSWLTMAPTGTWRPPAPADLAAEWAVHVDALGARGRRWLSGAELAGALDERIDGLFAGPRGGGSDPDAVPRLQHGIWNYHHTLRWFGRYLRALDATHAAAAAAVERAAQDLLVVRSLLRHTGQEDPARAGRHRTEARRRLDRIARGLDDAAARLAALPGVDRA
ncbi:hypothetical protein ACFVT9_12415 [Kitasatospora cineracea]|uniref:hypothetical protein n=1 Tax=Kitasatospora cineracea TaxID=88074 RepID=UPI0036DB9321